MTDHPTAVPLCDLSRDPANVRRTDKWATPPFVASMRAKGQLVPLLVRKNGQGGYYVIDGGKRLSALQLLAKEKAIAPDFMVKVEVREDSDLEARDTSLATAVIHDQLHPVDKFEAFAELRDGGMAPKEIAQRYGSTEKEVEKALALGALAPEVREAWREGTVNADCAKEFTLEPDHERQAKILANLKRSGLLRYQGQVRHAIVGDGQHETAAFLKYVGQEAYEAAGGRITRDLFGDQEYASDPALAKRLADEKLKAKCDQLVADGWAWAMPIGEAPSSYWGWGRLGVPKNKYTAEQKKDRGVIIQLKRDGTLEIEYGYSKPAAEKAPKATGSMAKALTPKKTSAGVISNSLMQRMSEWLTKASRLALPVDIDLALAALCAGFGSDHVIKVEERGHVDGRSRYGDGAGRKPTGNFEKLLDQFRKATREQNLAHLAKVAGTAVDMVTFSAHRPPLKDKNNAALCAAIPAKTMNAALREAFDAKNYFDSVSKPMVLAAIAEAVNEDEARKLQGKPKGEVAKFAVANVPKTGWLPKELRTAHYDGPAKKKPAKAASKKKAKPTKKAPARKKAKV